MHSEIKTKIKINLSTTCFHIFLIVTLVIVYSMDMVKFKNSLNFWKIMTTSTFDLGLQDIFVICMLWFVMDSENKPIF